MLANHYKITVPEKFVDQTVEQMKKVQAHFSERVDGCIKYQCSRDIEDPSILYIFVIWESREQYEKNLDSQYQKEEIFDKYIEFNAAIISAEQLSISHIADVV